MPSHEIKKFPIATLVVGCNSRKSFDRLSRAIVSTFVIATPPSNSDLSVRSSGGNTTFNSSAAKELHGTVNGATNDAFQHAAQRQTSCSNVDDARGAKKQDSYATNCCISSSQTHSPPLPPVSTQLLSLNENNTLYTDNVSSEQCYLQSASEVEQHDNVFSSGVSVLGNSHRTTPNRPRNSSLKLMIGNRALDTNLTEIIFELGQPVPSQFIELCELCPAMSTGEGLSEYTVLSSTPFKKGYINFATELLIILISVAPKLPTPTSHLRMPIVSDFLVRYKSYPSEDDSTVMSVLTLDGKDGTREDATNSHDQCIFVTSKFAHDFGVMDNGFVRVKLKDNVKRLRRHMKVVVSSGDDETCVKLSPICWFNLGGTELAQDRYVSIKRVAVASSTENGSVSPSSSASTHTQCDEISTAKQVTVARVKLAEDETFDISLTEPLQHYFLSDRYFCVNDVFLLRVAKLATGKEELVLVKVMKINNSDKTTLTYKVNRQTTLYEGTFVHSFIPAGVLPSTNINIGRSFEATRNNLVHLLKPFVKHDWHPHPVPFILLAGAEGSGRSLITRQVARLLQCNYVEVNCVNLVADAANSTETRIKEVLVQAQSISPSILSLRNIDILTKEEPMNVENPRIAQFFHTQVRETLEASDYPLLIFGTCAKFKAVSETIREAALHEVIIESPDVQERLNLLEELTAAIDVHPNVSLQYLADHTAGFLHGDLKALVVHAQRNSTVQAFSISKREFGFICEKSIKYAGILVNTEDFQKALDTIQSVQSLDLGAPKIPNVKWSDIGGLQQVKGDILDTIQLPLKHPELFISAMRRSGILLYGPPGTGKTLLAKAVATECALNFFSVKGPELINMYVGQSEENIRQVFHKARSASPCVIFFDELDSLAPNRGRSGDSGGVMDRVVSQLLAELDGLVKSCDVFVIGATNRPDLLDPALLRPGRFDKLVYVGISSTPDEQFTILKAITRKFNMEADCDLNLVSQRCPQNMTGADLYALCSEAMTNAIKRQIDQIQAGKSIDECELSVKLGDFMQAIEETTPSLSAVEIKRYEQVRARFSNIGTSSGEQQVNGDLGDALPMQGDSGTGKQKARKSRRPK